MVIGIERWTVKHLDEQVDTEFDELPKDIQAKFMHLAKLVEDLGLPNLREPYIKHIQGKLWELRVKAESGIGRGLFCSIRGRTVIILRYFKKKTPKTPRNEIEIALQRMKTMSNEEE